MTGDTTAFGRPAQVSIMNKSLEVHTDVFRETIIINTEALRLRGVSTSQFTKFKRFRKLY